MSCVARSVVLLRLFCVFLLSATLATVLNCVLFIYRVVQYYNGYVRCSSYSCVCFFCRNVGMGASLLLPPCCVDTARLTPNDKSQTQLNAQDV